MSSVHGNGIIRTKLAAALLAAVMEGGARGKNPGRLGKRVLTNNAKGVGIKFDPARGNRRRPAESAEEVQELKAA
jgi:hypothetical protein